MAEMKLTKNELRTQQNRLSTLSKYLPTLQLKKAMLQTEISVAKAELLQCELIYEKKHASIEAHASLLPEMQNIDPATLIEVQEIQKRYENIAGIEVPYFDSITFKKANYSLLESPPWLDSLAIAMQELIEASKRIDVAKEKKTVLEKELRDVSIKVNLFEKVLIPRATSNIKKIKVFLSDQQLAAVSQAKVAKRKIEERKQG